jgi:hypothetical protein
LKTKAKIIHDLELKTTTTRRGRDIHNKKLSGEQQSEQKAEKREKSDKKSLAVSINEPYKTVCLPLFLILFLFCRGVNTLSILNIHYIRKVTKLIDEKKTFQPPSFIREKIHSPP